MKRKLPLSMFELIAYGVLSLFALWGLIYVSLGIACEFISYKSGVASADTVLKGVFGGVGFLWGGIIILAVTVVVAVIILLANAKKSDRDYEKAQRRAARLKKNVVDAEVAPVEEKKSEE